jgi:hypothetical protein
MTMGTSSGSEHIYLSFWLFVFPSLLKFFLIREENYLVWIRWVSSGAQKFKHAGRVAYSADMFLKIKTVCLHVVIPEMHSFSMRPAKSLPKNLDPKTVLNYRLHSV